MLKIEDGLTNLNSDPNSKLGLLVKILVVDLDRVRMEAIDLFERWTNNENRTNSR